LNILRNLLGKKVTEHGKFSNNGLFVPKSSGKRYVISDVHGCLRTFKALFEKIDLKNEDQLFLLGDYVDRGPDSVGLVDFLIELKQRCNLFLLRGNHEEELLLMEQYEVKNLIESSILNDKLGGFYEKNLKLKPKYKAFFDSLLYFVELDKYMLVHAGFDFELESPFEDISSMLEIRNWSYNEKFAKKKTIIYGHSVTDFEDIVYAIKLKNKQIPLDNGCVYKNIDGLGSLLCICLENMKLIDQKNIDVF